MTVLASRKRNGKLPPFVRFSFYYEYMTNRLSRKFWKWRRQATLANFACFINLASRDDARREISSSASCPWKLLTNRNQSSNILLIDCNHFWSIPAHETPSLRRLEVDGYMLRLFITRSVPLACQPRHWLDEFAKLNLNYLRVFFCSFVFSQFSDTWKRALKEQVAIL